MHVACVTDIVQYNENTKATIEQKIINRDQLSIARLDCFVFVSYHPVHVQEVKCSVFMSST